MDERDRYAKGMEVRRAVLGDAHVDRAESKRNAFNEEFQELITRHAWGEIWDRPGLPRHTRSLLTIAMMVALNREDELRLHLRAAKNNGVTPDENSVYYYVGIDSARFKKPVVPGDQLEVEVHIERELRGISKFGCVARVAGQVVAEATILCAMQGIAGK